MDVQMQIQFEGKQLTLPVNPERLNINRSATNEDIDIIGLGKATRKGEPGLTKISIESFFPAANSYFYTGVTPKTCVEFINKIWLTENINNKVAKIVITGLPISINMFFVIDTFTPEIRAGEEDDIYYSLSIKEYIPYGVKIVNVQKSGLAASRAQSNAKQTASEASAGDSIAGTQSTYTVVSGDCLWNIAKACCGDGGRWKELYELNKAVIGSNPNLIKPGQVLVLPSGWNSPTNVTKLTNVGNKNTSKSSVGASNNNSTTKKVTIDKTKVNNLISSSMMKKGISNLNAKSPTRKTIYDIRYRFSSASKKILYNK